jgi:transcriptional regulator with XRE-family HTH domain
MRQVERSRSKSPPTDGTLLDNASERRQIGERIKSARMSAGFTQRALATKLDISAGAVGQWETGGGPATERLAMLADILGVSLDWLLGTSGQAAKPAGTERDMQEDVRLVEEARHLGVDLRRVVAEARQQRWVEENRGALADANAFLARHGLWSDGKRQF